ncbi:MAG: DMT family transporter [Pseudomonadota bacterium]
MSTTGSPSTKDWIMIATLAFIWGGSFLFGRILMLEWPPFTVVFLRVALAAAALWVFLLITQRSFPTDRRFLCAILIMGVLNNVIPFSLILIGQREIGSGLAAVVNAMTPIWTLIIANRFTSDEKISANKITGILLGFAGVGVLIGGDLIQGLTASAWAQGAVLGATISYGFAGVFGKRFRDQDPITVSTGQLTASSLVIFPVMLITEGFFNISSPDTELVIATLGLSILCTALTYVLFFKILASAGATNVSLVTFLVPVSAILLGIIWLGEQLTIGNVVGLLLIIAGLVFVDGRLIHRMRPSKT